jgi:gas vesicle protein
MELLYIIGILVGLYVALATLVWFAREVGKFLDTLRYNAKLKKLSPQIDTINVHELSSRLSATKQSYILSTKLIEQGYKIREKVEQAKTIKQYVQDEAAYRRSKRRKPSRTNRRRYRRYY